MRKKSPSMYFLFSSLLGLGFLILASQFSLLRVREESMAPTLVNGQWMLVLRGSWRVRSGDVAVFINPINKKMTVKRCVLWAGDPIRINHGWLLTDWGRWFLNASQWERLKKSTTFPSPSCFLVGDNQFHSFDSRHYGYIPLDQFVGRVLLSSPKDKQND